MKDLYIKVIYLLFVFCYCNLELLVCRFAIIFIMQYSIIVFFFGVSFSESMFRESLQI